jgi:hypothetical protein
VSRSSTPAPPDHDDEGSEDEEDHQPKTAPNKVIYLIKTPSKTFEIISFRFHLLNLHQQRKHISHHFLVQHRRLIFH